MATWPSTAKTARKRCGSYNRKLRSCSEEFFSVQGNKTSYYSPNKLAMVPEVRKDLAIKVKSTQNNLSTSLPNEYMACTESFAHKLLGWMHRKLRQNGSETLKDFASGSGEAKCNPCNYLVGQPSLDDQQYYTKPNYGSRTFRQAPKEQLRKSFAGLEAAQVEEGEGEDYEEESSAAISELFHGFLAIGTLGSEPVNADPSTPTFPISVENITEKETEVTENELKLINDELEKVLAEDCSNESSGRNSHVSAGRSSHGSTITLSGKPMEGRDSNAVCPLQGYLFGSAIEMSDTAPVAKKEHRTTLGELFQKTKIAEENYGVKFEREEKRVEKEADKSSVNLMKKILKKKLLHASSRSSTSAGGATVDSASAETKMHKILHMFHRKVHPESSTSTRKVKKAPKTENKKSNNNGGNNNEGQMLLDEDITIVPRTLSKRSIRRFKSQSNPPHFMFTGCDSNGSRECWIKTDADWTGHGSPNFSNSTRHHMTGNGACFVRSCNCPNSVLCVVHCRPGVGAVKGK
ncbi:hypothetical protein SADUNF_Sadunf01G0045100 [Salix dunnii]|uniref:Uncharacterized protein n=1 Tax=Salix dunnii TaxID=1413687 RepID=A0A835N9W1_9ROSI|nr:hypothetical protein SADUNF_Sadunf01G0045100 [Salix dunnii]